MYINRLVRFFVTLFVVCLLWACSDVARACCACDHPDNVVLISPVWTSKFTSLDSEYHLRQYYAKGVCYKCDEQGGKGFVYCFSNQEETEAHRLNERGKCKDCNNPAYCQHIEREIYGDPTKISYSDSEEHFVLGPVWIICDLCGTYLEGGGVYMGHRPHEFVDGICVCGYTQASGSTVTPKPTVTSAPGACPPHTPITEHLYTTYNPINDSKHDVLIHNKVTCSACGTVIDPNNVETQWAFHDFGSGSTCLECGYNKAGYYMSVDQGHINGLAAYVGGGQGATINVTSNVEWTAVPDVNWIHIDNWTGSGNGSFSVSVDANTGYAREGHILVVGTHGASIDIKVSQEGAIVNPETCSHVYGYDYADATDGEWQKVDDDTHKRVTLLYKDVCTLCGDVRYQRRADESEVIESHTWGRTNWQNYKKRNEDEHYRTGITSCTAAGCTATKNVVETAAHVWDNRECDVCGYEDEYDCAAEGHVDQDEDRVCDMCWEYLPYSMRIDFRMENDNLVDKLTYMQIMETGILDSAYITGYSQYVQGLEAVGSMSVKKWVEANPNLLKFHSINMNQEHTEEIVAKIYVDYIYNYDAGDAVNKLTDEECSEMLEKIEQYIPGMTAVITTIGSGETLYKTLLELDGASVYDMVISSSLSAGLSVTIEGYDRVLCMAKASIVRRRLEQDLGGVDHLPEELQDEMNQMLDIWESELANTLELGVTALDSIGSKTVKQAMSACPILKVAHGALSVYTSTTNYDEIGAGLEDIYAIKIMTERASEVFELAFDEYQQNPTPENYREFVKQKNTYRSYLTVGAATYRDWCIEEAPSEFDLDFWNHGKKTKTRIDEANSNYEAEMERIESYFELFD